MELNKESVLLGFGPKYFGFGSELLNVLRRIFEENCLCERNY